MNKTESKAAQMVKVTLTVTADTHERILRACETFLCSPGRYIDILVECDQHLTPRERLEFERDLMLEDAADASPCSG